jgi:hypothetical protein
MSESSNLPPTQTSPSASNNAPAAPTAAEEPATATTVRCALTGEEISSEEAHWAPPLVTLNQLFAAVFDKNRETGSLTTVLFAEQPDVPYSPRAREELASRRTTEQLKFLGLVLVVLLILAGLVFMLMGLV